MKTFREYFLSEAEDKKGLEKELKKIVESVGGKYLSNTRNDVGFLPETKKGALYTVYKDFKKIILLPLKQLGQNDTEGWNEGTRRYPKKPDVLDVDAYDVINKIKKIENYDKFIELEAVSMYTPYFPNVYITDTGHGLGGVIDRRDIKEHYVDRVVAIRFLKV